jgi:hypothetical protein
MTDEPPKLLFTFGTLIGRTVACSRAAFLLSGRATSSAARLDLRTCAGSMRMT